MALYELQQQDIRPFRLSEEFLDPYKTRKPDFGFNGLGELTYRRTYSRIMPDGKKEEWWQTIRRVIEGVYTMQKKWIVTNNLGWDNIKAQKSAKEMYERMFVMKFLPAGRGLWAWGSPITEEKGLYLALNSCAMVTTETIKEKLAEPFCFLMDASMLGVGVGFDTKGADKIIINEPSIETDTYQISDDREGWVISVEKLINSYFLPNQKTIQFDYSLIRPAGELIKGFGGVASGSEALARLHNDMRMLLNKRIGQRITSRDIVDIMNMIGKCVIAGNVRRTAEIAFGEVDDDEFLNLKNYELNPERMDYGWTSNNSIFAQVGMDYNNIADRIKDNGEPGLEWLENARAYSRMGDAPDYKDRKVVGANPSLRIGTKIITDNGIFPIEKLEGQKFKVINLDGQWSNAECFLSGENKPLYRVILSGNVEYFATDEHKWAITTGKHNEPFSKKKTSELVKGDKLPINTVSKEHFGNLGTYSDGFLCGWIYGDGWITKRGDSGQTQIGMVISKKDGIYGGIKPIIEEKLKEIGIHTSLPFRERKGIQGWYEFSTQNKTLEGFLSNFGCSNKRNGLPSEIWNGVTKEFTYGFLDGLLSSDGNVEKGKRVSLSSAHENLAKDVLDLLGCLGIPANMHKRTTRLKGYDKSYISYVIRFQGHYLDNKFSLSNKFKQDRLNEMSEGIIHKSPLRHVVSVTKTHLSENVWDITVYDDTHCFSLPNVITGNCNEQSLESMETCLLVESFPNRNENLEDYKRTLKFAYLYAKTVTLAKTHWAETNRVMLRNRRIGLSMSGIAQFITDRGLNELKQWCEEGYKTIRYYDNVYSDWLAIPKSIKVTSVKPSGSVSLLAGATAGIHYPESNFYIRRIRLSKFSDLIEPLQNAGYKVELAVGQEDSTVVVEFPVSLGKKMRTIKDLSMWEQLSLGAFMQRYWSDNQVSQTVTFNPELEGKDIAHALEYFQYQLKGVSFLPTLEYGAYPQMPYEAITEDEYNDMMSKITVADFSSNVEDAIDEKFCNNDVCTI